nr:methyltransferase domain-containing protein [Allopusillimonas ginsengisoli]
MPDSDIDMQKELFCGPEKGLAFPVMDHMILPTLVFIHGWAFEVDFWQPLRHALRGWPQHAIDLGYFQKGGAITHPAELPAGPLVMIGHSFGFMHALATAPAQVRAWVSINGFSRFSAAPGFDQGVAARLLQRMMTRLQGNPEGVVNEFRHRCGTQKVAHAPNVDALRRDLQRMQHEDRRQAQAVCMTDTLILAGDADPIVPVDMTRALFGEENVVWKAGGGHLLPWDHTLWCAAQIESFLRWRFPAEGSDAGSLAADKPASRGHSQASLGTPVRKMQIRERFGAAAASYEQQAFVQHTVAQELARRIAALDIPARPHILEIGCGTGLLTREMAGFIDEATWVITDIAQPMLNATKQAVHLPGVSHYVLMDGEYPDQALSARIAGAAGFGLICSSMAVQWFQDLEAGLARLAALLAPGGYLAIATLAEGTFAEWQHAHRALGLVPATLVFPSVESIGETLPANKGLEGGVQSECITQECGSALAFLRGLKAIGATAPAPGRRPLSSRQLCRVCEAFDQSGAKASYQVAYGIWRKQP